MNSKTEKSFKEGDIRTVEFHCKDDKDVAVWIYKENKNEDEIDPLGNYIHVQLKDWKIKIGIDAYIETDIRKLPKDVFVPEIRLY